MPASAHAVRFGEPPVARPLIDGGWPQAAFPFGSWRGAGWAHVAGDKTDDGEEEGGDATDHAEGCPSVVHFCTPKSAVLYEVYPDLDPRSCVNTSVKLCTHVDCSIVA